jgi:hypothetical protein
VQAGTLRLDAPLGTYLPDYPNAEVASKVTPHHLLTHTGGTGDIFGPEFTARPDRAPHDGGLPPALRHARPAVRAGGAVGVQQLRLPAPRRPRRAGGRDELRRPRRGARARAGGDDGHRLGAGGLARARAVGRLHAAGGARRARVERADAALPRHARGGRVLHRGGPRALRRRAREHRLLDRRTRRCSSPGRSRSATGAIRVRVLDRVVGGRRFVGHGGGAPG